MVGYIADLTIVALLIIGFTALLGVLTNGIGEKIFGGKNKSEFVDQSARVQTGWKSVGGQKSSSLCLYTMIPYTKFVSNNM